MKQPETIQLSAKKIDYAASSKGDEGEKLKTPPPPMVGGRSRGARVRRFNRFTRQARLPGEQGFSRVLVARQPVSIRQAQDLIPSHLIKPHTNQPAIPADREALGARQLPHDGYRHGLRLAPIRPAACFEQIG